MAEENIPQVKEMIPEEIIEETSVETMPLMVEEIQTDDDVAVSNDNVNLRRFSTGALDKRGSPPGKAQVQTRYRGNQTSSTHDLCKHGKRRENDLVIKPWKLVKKKNVEGSGGDLVKGETLSVIRKSLQDAKSDAAATSEVKRRETKITITPSDSAGVRMVKKTTVDVKKVSRISESQSSKEDLLKSLKNKEKKDTDDVSEKTLYVDESSIAEKKMKKKSVKSEIQQSSEKKVLRGSGKKSLTLTPSLSPSLVEVKESRVTKSDPRPIRRITSMYKTGRSEKKESGSATLVTNSKTESKIRPPKRIGLKVIPPPGPPTRPVSFKKGKVLEPKPEDSTSTSIKFKKRVVQEPKLRSDVNKNKKNLKDKREGVGKMSYNSGEGKREKVVLRHRKVEAKKKLQTLFNNVIEETVNKLEEVRKSKVKALVGAFETVISLQDKDKTSQKKKIQSKSTSSQVS